ncbi:hypothetical protein SLS60_002357 [Paraconiothyrium brasiliense]|uniref:Uncharacterized protein n=1 Tax=Paraconiothyrium brasiliense TaxID=300254 RepID=A0ABR3S233_9PLEO
MVRQYLHRSSRSQARDRHEETRYDRQRDGYRIAKPARRYTGDIDRWTPEDRSDRVYFRRSSSGSSHRRPSSGGFLGRRRSSNYYSSSDDSPSDRPSGGYFQDSVRRPEWEDEMERYMETVKYDIGGQRALDPMTNDPRVRLDRQKRRHHYYGELAANQFDVSLKHVRCLLHHMLDRYDTVACYSVHLIEEGDIIYYLDPFIIGLDQEVEGKASDFLGGQRFQAGVKVKGRFGIVTRKIGQTLKVVPISTFNGAGLETKPRSVRNEYVELRDPEHCYSRNESPHEPLEVERAFCDMKQGAAVHLITSRVSLNSQILIAGSITPGSLEKLRNMVYQIEG